MRMVSFPSYVHYIARWLLLVVLVCTALPGATRAQEQTPVPSPTPEPLQDMTASPAPRIHDHVIVDPHTSTVTPAIQSASPLASEASTAANPFEVMAGIQGDIKVDVAVNDKVRAGDTLQYTYIYTNTRSSAANVVLRATWSDFKVGVNQARQFCTATPDPHPTCEPFSVSGPAVTKQNGTGCAAADSGPLCYTLTLAAGQKGSFVVQVGIQRTSYPQTNTTPYRPSGSVQLFLDTGGDRISEDTASSLIVGPVLILVKKAVDTTKKVFPVKSSTPRPADSEIAEFSLVASNATGTGDSPGGTLRADATNATNITIVDTFPAGADFIEATGSPAVDTTKRTVTWVIPGPLKPGAALPELRVKYVKTDVNLECGSINNNTLNVTSDEYPLGTTGTPPARLAVAGSSASTPVITPVIIDSVTASPPQITFGDSSTITILVKSAWTQPISGLKLTYAVQSNAAYTANSASPNNATVDTTGPTPTLNWTFDMPAAANRTTPQAKEFKLTVQGGYNESVKYGQAQLTLPATIPSACTKAVTGVVGLTPRLALTKKILDPLPSYGNVYYTTQQTEVHYQIEVVNSGNADASNIDVTDVLPSDMGANFRYKGGSSTVNGTPITPQVSDGIGGTIVWSDLAAGAKSTTTIVFTLIVDGLDYVKYCNDAKATINDTTDERIIKPPVLVCVKFNPDIEITKTVNGGTATVTAQPGDTVTFKLTMTNHESVAYNIGLYDSMGKFTYKAMKSGYDMNPTFDGTNLKWQSVSVAPGETKAVEFTALVPASCSTTDYLNEALFYNKDFIVQPVPRVLTTVKVGCGLEYGASASTGQASLEDNLVYTLRVTNKNTVELKNIVVTNTLPLGFTFIRMDPTSDVSTTPKTNTLADGRIQQRWVIGSISGSKTTQIKLVTRTTSVVGKWYNQMTVEGGTCTGNCRNDDIDKTPGSGAAVTVAPLITAEPKITLAAACATPNDTIVYQVSIVNTNSHAYANTAVTVTLPLGLSFVKPISNTMTPLVTPLSTGATQVVWRNMTIPTKTGNFSQVVLMMQLKVGNVLGNLSAQVQTSSTDGSIPRKEGVVDPTISVCLPNPAIAKLANALTIKPNGDIVYDIILANPKATSITVTIEDQLPTGLKYSGIISATGNIAPTLSNNSTKLTWTDVSIPTANGNLVGEVHLRFTVTGTSATLGQQYKNTATVVKSSETLDTSRASYTVTVAKPMQSVYLPLMRRK